MKSPTGNAWAKTSLRRLIETQTVIGNYQPHTSVSGTRKPVGDIIKGYYPAIVDEDTYWNVRHKTEANGGSNAGRKGRMGNLFSKLVTCAGCGSTVRYFDKGAGSKGGRYLACVSRVDGLGCEIPYMQYPQAEKVLLGWLHFEGVRLLNPEVPEVDFDALRAKLNENQKQQDNLLDFIQEFGRTEKVGQRFSELQIEEANLRGQLAEKAPERRSEDEFRRLIEHIRDPLGRSELARQIKRLGIKIVIGEDLIEVVDKVTFTRSYERGYWLWKGSNCQSIPIEMRGYKKRISGLQKNWGENGKPKESRFKDEWDYFASYPSELRIFEELDDPEHIEVEQSDEILLQHR